jgi:ABC-type branched-subunit amino acid transport system substrate-binding protein
VSARALVAAAAVLVLAGCEKQEAILRGGTVIGSTLTVYSSLPAPSRGASRDIVDGEKLALAEAQGRAGAYTINFSSLDEASPEPSGAAARAAAVTRQAITDTQTMAVIGSLHSDTAMSAIPLLNEAGILHLSPGAAYPGFTTRVAEGEPERWFPAARSTFARVVGDDRAQARALVAAAGSRRIVIEAEASEEASALAAELRRAAAAAGATVGDRPDRAGAVIYAGLDPENAAGVAEGLTREAPKARVVLPEAVVRAGVQERLTPAAARRAVLVSAAPEPGSTPALQRFEAAFRREFGRAPGPYAAIGHAAMSSVLSAIAHAGKRAGDRQAVIDAFFRAGGADTVLGRLSVRESGDLAEPRFSVSRLRGERREYLSGD